MRSQFTVSPKGELIRTPSWNTESPGGVPSSGDPVNPRKLMSGWYGFPCDWLMFTLSKVRSIRSGSVIVPGLRRSCASPDCTFAGTLSLGTPSPGSGVGATTSTGGALTPFSSDWAYAATQMPQASIPSRPPLARVAPPGLSRCCCMVLPLLRGEVSVAHVRSIGRNSRSVRDDFGEQSYEIHLFEHRCVTLRRNRSGRAHGGRHATIRAHHERLLPVLIRHGSRVAAERRRRRDRRHGCHGARLLRRLAARSPGADRRAHAAARAVPG